MNYFSKISLDCPRDFTLVLYISVEANKNLPQYLAWARLISKSRCPQDLTTQRVRTTHRPAWYSVPTMCLWPSAVRLTYTSILGFQAQWMPQSRQSPYSTIKADGNLVIQMVRTEPKFLAAGLYLTTLRQNSKWRSLINSVSGKWGMFHQGHQGMCQGIAV